MGYDGEKVTSYEGINGTGGIQTFGGYCVCNSTYCGTAWNWSIYGKRYCYGGFGYGGITPAGGATSVAGAGGSGYYGGGSSFHASAAGGGESSFISGYDGCDAKSEQTTEDNITHTGQSIHYSGLFFSDTIMMEMCLLK